MLIKTKSTSYAKCIKTEYPMKIYKINIFKIIRDEIKIKNKILKIYNMSRLYFKRQQKSKHAPYNTYFIEHLKTHRYDCITFIKVE